MISTYRWRQKLRRRAPRRTGRHDLLGNLDEKLDPINGRPLFRSRQLNPGTRWSIYGSGSTACAAKPISAFGVET